LFNLAADSLAHVLNKAKNRGYIKGVVPHLIRGVTHLQYADDTILLCECEGQNLANLKFLLYCFEWMLGLKINYHKSEVVTFGVDEDTELNIAKMLNCSIGKLPIKYLGFPINNKRLG
jgi:hypothetical protein